MTPLQSLVASGTKLWLDSIDPELVKSNRAEGATGATSNPIIVSDLIKTGRFDAEIEKLIGEGLDDEAIAWEMTDQLVRQAQVVFVQQRLDLHVGGLDDFVLEQVRGFCWSLCWLLAALIQGVHLVSRSKSQTIETSHDTAKTALKRESQGRKLVAGLGFEPRTFRL